MENKKQAMVDFLNHLDYRPLFKHAEELAGINLDFSDVEVKEVRGEVYAEFTSQNLATEGCGIFGKVLESCVISPFSSGIYEAEDGDFVYWANINLRYRHLDGGMNGMNLFTVQFKDNKWSFRDVGQR